MARTITGCANIIPPAGGPRDTLPPVLIHALPRDSATMVASNKIVLTFNEFVEAKDISNNLVVSPLPKQSPVVDYKLNTVTIKLKDTLTPNTTYTLNFGNAIKDINEGNVAKNFSYVFSTGPKIDSGFFAGKVLLANSGKIDSTLIVALYKNLDDSAVVKTLPRYYAKLDGKGNFVFHHLPVGTFNAFVMENGFDKKYNDSTKVFAFLNKPVHISDTTGPALFYAYAQVEKKDKGKPGSATGAKTAPPKSKTEIKFKMVPQLDNGHQELIAPLELEFTRKLKVFDTAKIILCDTLFRPLKAMAYHIDTSAQKLSIQYGWREDMPYRVIVMQDAVTDTGGAHLAKTDTLKFFTKKESDYGSLKIRFLNIDLNKNPVLQFYQGDNLSESVVLTKNEFFRKLIKPGDYELRVLYDDNKNGKWDAGNYKLKKQPEIVQDIPKKINVRNNWENEVSINL